MGVPGTYNIQTGIATISCTKTKGYSRHLQCTNGDSNDLLIQNVWVLLAQMAIATISYTKRKGTPDTYNARKGMSPLQNVGVLQASATFEYK